MATRASIATGLFSAAGTWGLCDATVESDSEAATAVVPTSAGASSDSAASTPGVITSDGVYLKLAIRNGSTGTLTVTLRNSTLSSDVTSTTINVSDLENVATQGGWFFVKWSASQTLVGATGYLIRCVTSSANQLTLYTASGNNWSRQLRTTTTGAPAATDKLIIAGEYTGAGTSNSFTVTYDSTATTSYGARTSGVTAIAVCAKGTLTWQTTASTAYYLKLGGLFNVYSGGTVNCGTSGTVMPSTSSAVIEFDCVANVDYGLELRNGATWNAYGASKTSLQTKMTVARGGLCSTVGTAVTGLEGQSFTGLSGTIRINSVNYTISSVTDSTHIVLTGSAGTQNVVPWVHAGTGVTVTVGDTTGWAASDTLCFASTTRTAADCESQTIATVDSSTQVTLNTALANYHGGQNDANGDIRAEVGNLTRNVKIRGISTTLQGYVNVAATAVVNCQYVEFYQLGSATVSKRGIDVATTTGTFNVQYCSLHDNIVASSLGLNVSSASGSGITFSNNVLYNIYSGFYVNVATTGVQTVSGNLCMLTTTSIVGLFGFSLSDAGGTYTNNTVVGIASNTVQNAFLISEGGAALGTVSGNVIHSCNGNAISVTGVQSGTMLNFSAWRNNVAWVNGILRGPIVISGLVAFGNVINITPQAQVAGTLFTGCTVNAGANLSSTVGVNLQTTNCGPIYFDSCSFGATTAHATADIQSGTAGLAVLAFFYNCLLASTTEFSAISGQSGMALGSFFRSEKHDQTAGNHKTWKTEGTITTDTSLFDVTPSVRLTPLSASLKLETGAPGQQFRVPIANGATITFSVKVRKSVAGDGTAYNGNQPRLIVKKNVAMGIAADTVLATGSAAAGTWETLSGTTAAVTDDGALDFVVDCDGTLGWVNVDTVSFSRSAPLAESTAGMKYWADGLPVSAVEALGGGLFRVPGMQGGFPA